MEQCSGVDCTILVSICLKGLQPSSHVKFLVSLIDMYQLDEVSLGWLGYMDSADAGGPTDGSMCSLQPLSSMRRTEPFHAHVSYVRSGNGRSGFEHGAHCTGHDRPALTVCYRRLSSEDENLLKRTHSDFTESGTWQLGDYGLYATVRRLIGQTAHVSCTRQTQCRVSGAKSHVHPGTELLGLHASPLVGAQVVRSTNASASQTSLDEGVT